RGEHEEKVQGQEEPGCQSQQPACGRAVRNSRIIGGQDATPGSWSWHALVVTYGPYGYKQCGGSLITNQWVLTAARCIPISSNNTVVHLGRYNQSGLNPNEVTQKVKETICHPAFSFYCWTYENDICLLKLSAPVNFTDYIQPICLASEKSTFHNGTSSRVTGFGYDDSYRFSNILQEVNVPILGNNECRCHFENYYYYYWLPQITENVTCTGPKVGWKGPFYGDEGEPLMIKAGSLWVQSGVQSYSYGCGGLSIYTRVSQYQKWISDTVTGTPPGFVTFSSPGTDSDLNFTCPTSPPPSYNIFYDNVSISNPLFPSTDGSVFGSSENLFHLTHVTSLCVLVALLHAFVVSGM
ncbi:chymotrypsin-like protease CTRL-1, partial [Oreochromis niloticus]|uniref:chymotrypsin-like protease CTRL-1 n=1 Tax=Oreochromis niloticus TaxID=8128 RepID=UPI000DF354D4